MLCLAATTKNWFNRKQNRELSSTWVYFCKSPSSNFTCSLNFLREGYAAQLLREILTFLLTCIWCLWLNLSFLPFLCLLLLIPFSVDSIFSLADLTKALYNCWLTLHPSCNTWLHIPDPAMPGQVRIESLAKFVIYLTSFFRTSHCQSTCRRDRTMRRFATKLWRRGSLTRRPRAFFRKFKTSKGHWCPPPTQLRRPPRGAKQGPRGTSPRNARRQGDQPATGRKPITESTKHRRMIIRLQRHPRGQGPTLPDQHQGSRIKDPKTKQGHQTKAWWLAEA